MSEQNFSSPAMNEHIEGDERDSSMSRTPVKNPAQRQTNLRF